MSTYLQGVKDYIPQVQAFAPDFNFYNKALSFKQGKYDAARKQLSNVYGSLLNAPLTREDNEESRQEFFNIIDQDIKKMAGTDLSLVQNSEAAQGVFNQLTDNKAVVKDMVWTKNFQNQQRKSKSFKNCVDPEKCGGAWWSGGDSLLGYDYEAFKNASAEDALTMRNAEYVAYQDITKKGLALAKEADLNVTFDQTKGGYIYTTKNGPNLARPLSELFKGSLAKDPKIKDYYRAKARLERENFTRHNTEQYGSKEAAEQEYIKQKTAHLEAIFDKEDERTEDAIEGTKAKADIVKKAMTKTIPGKRAGMQDALDGFTKQAAGMQSSLEESKEVKGTMDVGKQQGYTGSQLDSIYGSLYLGGDINGLSQTLAMKDYSVTKKADPYALEATKQANRMLMAETNYTYKYKLEQLKGTIKTKGAARGSGESNVPVTTSGLPGSTTAALYEEGSDEYKERGAVAWDDDYSQIKDGVSANETILVRDTFKHTLQAAEHDNNQQAKEDYIKLVETGGFGKDVTKEINAAVGTAAKFEIARQYRFQGSNHGGVDIDNVYNSTVAAMLNPAEQNNKALRPYLGTVWAKNQNKVRGIKVKNRILGELDTYYGTESKKVAKHVRSDANWEKGWADAFEVYIDDKGKPVEQGIFINSMVKRGYSAEKALELYNPSDDDDPNIEKMYRRAFTQYARPTGDMAGGQLFGIGDEVGKAFTYARVDPSEYESAATMGTVGIIRDGLSLSEATINFGSFRDKNPTKTNPKARAILEQMHTDAKNTDPKDKNRGIYSVTYSHIAGGDPDMVAVNIKLSESYRKKYAGSTNNPGLFNDQSLSTEGIYITMPKSQATNLFTLGSQETDVDREMRWTNEVDLPIYPDYTEGLKLTKDDITNEYILEGYVQSAVDENGKTKNVYMTQPVSSQGSLADAVRVSEQYIGNIVKTNRQLEQNYLNKNKGK